MSNKMINIGGDANDVNYRYKMPPLQTKIEGRGNGIKTVLMNIPDVAKHLHTEPSYATKFFGMEVGALSQYDHKRNVGIVHGVHQPKDLQVMLQKFIREFILCEKCKLPELQFKVHQKKNILLQKCASCGWKGSNGSTHKVKTYIINHPPKKKDKDKGRSSKDKGKSKKGKKDRHKNKGDEDNKEANEDKAYKELGWDNDEVWSVDISEDAVAQRKQREMATLATKNKRKKNVPKEAQSKKKSKTNDDNSPPQILRNYVDSCERNTLEILDEIKRISLARKFDAKKKLQLTLEALCKLDTMERFIESLKTYKVLLQRFTTNNEDAKLFMGVLEEFVCKRNPEALLGKVYVILECVYDEEIVSDEDIILWADMPTDKAMFVEKDDAETIRERAAPLIKWLKENDSEESGSEEEEQEEADS
eukprot:17226_1